MIQTVYYTLKRLGNTEKKNASYKYKGLSVKKLITLTTNNSLSQSIKWYRNSNFCLVFKIE